MKTRYLIVLLVAFILSLGLTTFSYAAGGHSGGGYEGVRDIDNRLRAAHERIDRGIESGALTRGEAHRLKGELNAVRDNEARMRADGRLNPHERDRLDRELDRLERHIAALKHNDNTRGNDDRHGHEGVRDIHNRIKIAHEKIDRGIQSGALTREEAHRLKGELNAVRDNEARMRADGRLNRHEIERLDRELDRLERHIANLKHNDNRRDHDRDGDRHHRPSCHKDCDRAYNSERSCRGLGGDKLERCVKKVAKREQQCKDKCDSDGRR